MKHQKLALLIVAALGVAQGEETVPMNLVPSVGSRTVIVSPTKRPEGNEFNLKVTEQELEGQAIIGSLLKTLNEERARLIDDKAALAKAEIYLQNTKIVRNGALGSMAVTIPVGLLLFRYGVKKDNTVAGVGGILLGGFAGPVGGLIAADQGAKGLNLKADIGSLKVKMEEKRLYLDKLEDSIREYRKDLKAGAR